MNTYSLSRQPVYARSGMDATSQPLAAQAGVFILRQGGNAVDAAVATAAALTVVEPTSNGLGSDLFALVWADGKLHGLNASGRSPALLSREVLPEGKLPTHGWLPVTVPGAVRGWADLHARFGRLPDDASATQMLQDEIVLTHEVRRLANAWKREGALLFGLSDKPDEASVPTPEMAAQGYVAIHRAVTHVIGE